MNTITMSARHRHAVPRRPAAAQLDRRTRSSCRSSAPFAGTVWFVLKLLVFLYIYVWFRATLPRLRYDQLMDLGWKLLIPVVARLVPAARRAPASASDEDWNRVARRRRRRRRASLAVAACC